MINAGFPLVLIILKLKVLYLLAPQIRHSLKMNGDVSWNAFRSRSAPRTTTATAFPWSTTVSFSPIKRHEEGFAFECSVSSSCH